MASTRIAFQPSLMLITAGHESSSFTKSNSADAFGRRGRIFNSGLVPSLIRTGWGGRGRGIICMNGNSTAEDYQKFAELLGGGPETPIESASRLRNTAEKETPESSSNALSPPDRRRERADEQEQYDQFSEMLGLEAMPKTNVDNPTGKKTLGIPKKVEIDPQDYQEFDSLLARSGGKGKKPIKGSKRYRTRREALAENIGAMGSIDDDEGIVSLDDFEEQQVLPTLQKKPVYLTQEETAQAYAIMREEFGTGMHSPGVELFSEDDNEVDGLPTVPPSLLRQPPRRPGAHQNESKVRGNARSQNQIRETEDSASKSPVLRAPPMRPAGIEREIAEPSKEKMSWEYDETHCAPAKPAEGEFFPDPLMPKPKRPGVDITSKTAESALGRNLQEIPRSREENVEESEVIELLRAPPVRPSESAAERTFPSSAEAFMPDPDKSPSREDEVSDVEDIAFLRTPPVRPGGSGAERAHQPVAEFVSADSDELGSKRLAAMEANVDPEVALAMKPKREEDLEQKVADTVLIEGGDETSIDEHEGLKKQITSARKSQVFEGLASSLSRTDSFSKNEQEQVGSTEMKLELIAPPDRKTTEHERESDEGRRKQTRRKASKRWQRASAGAVAPSELQVGGRLRGDWSAMKVVHLENPLLILREGLEGVILDEGFTDVEVIE